MKTCNSESPTPKSTMKFNHREAPCQDRQSHQVRAKIKNPIQFGRYVDEDDAVLVSISRREVEKGTRKKARSTSISSPPGPATRSTTTPSKTKCAVVTCGGLCPGLNDVIRAIVMAAHHEYRVPSVLGIQYGLAGFVPGAGLRRHRTDPGLRQRASTNSAARCWAPRAAPRTRRLIVDALERMNVSILFMIGGDGTMRAASHRGGRDRQARAVHLRGRPAQDH